VLQIANLETAAGEFQLRNVTLTATEGSYGVLLGPPGSGKSVLIETICGLRIPVAGRVFIDGVDVTNLDPRHRSIGYVPQDYVLFPAKRVIDNVTFGLRAAGLDRASAIQRVGWVLDLLEIAHLANRWPVTLSGGERQRVALARAIAIRPRLLLLDEPVSALDEGLRERVCRDLRRFQRELKITTVHISHNLEEALAVSDWAAILDDGVLQQVGSMGELLREPANEMVARFLRTENILAATAEPLDDSMSRLTLAGASILAAGKHRGEVTLTVRPESLRVAPAGSGEPGAVEATLTDVSDRGMVQRLEFDAGVRIVVFAPVDHGRQTFTPGEKYAVLFPADAIHVLRRP